MKLYEIANDYLELYQRLEEEGLEETEIHDHLESISDAFSEKARNLAKIIKNVESDIDAIKKEEDRLKKRRQVKLNHIESMKSYIANEMQRLECTHIDNPEMDIRVRNNAPKMIITQPGKVPFEYQEVEVKVDKQGLKNAINSGQVDEWQEFAYFEDDNKTIQIK